MTKQVSVVQEICNDAIREQGVGKRFLIVMTETDHAAIQERAGQDMEKIAQAAGVKMRKTAHIAVRRGIRRQQETALKDLNEMLRIIKGTSDIKEAIKWGMFAAGYANGMCCGDLISESERHDVVEVIDQAFKSTELRIENENAKNHFWRRMARKWVQT